MPLRYKSQMRLLRPAAHWVNGNQVSLESLRTRPVLIHFFSVSSEESLRQLAWLHRWMHRYERLQFVGVHTPLEVFDMDHARVEARIREMGLRHPVALDGDDGALADLYDVRGSPAYFLFDDQLRLRNQRSGPGAAEAMERILARVFPSSTRDQSSSSDR